MKKIIATAFSVLAFVSSNAMAGPCSAEGYETQLDVAGITAALSNKRIVTDGDAEDHCSNGALYKVGVSSNDPVDPRVYRGMWVTSGSGDNSQVTYNYTVGGNSSFSLKLWENTSGGLCWEDSNKVVAILLASSSFTGTCDIP